MQKIREETENLKQSKSAPLMDSWAAFQSSIRANGEDDLKAYLAALESAREQGYDTVHR